MVQAVTVGLDIAKNVFHAYGVDAGGAKAFSRKLRRSQVEAFFAKFEPCLIGIEACATAHHWARTLETMGHQVQLMPPAYVKPYVKTQKNDEADAEAICEAVGRPNMRFAEIKTVEQQSVLVLHRTRTMLIKHRTRMGNTIRAHLAEFSITEAIGREGLSRLIDMIVAGEDDRIAGVSRRAMMCLVEQYRLLQGQILDLDRQVMAWHRSNEASKRLATIPGIGPLAASALVASVGDASSFKNGRSFAAFIGLVPRQSFEWWKGAPRQDIEAGRPLLEMASCRRKPGSHPIRSASRHEAPLADQASAAAQDQDRRCRDGQQDGANCLGADGAWRCVSRTSCAIDIGNGEPMPGALHEVGKD